MNFLGKEDPNNNLLGMALNAARRGAVLTARLLAFARKQSLQMHTVDLQSLIQGMRELLQRTLGETIRVEIEDSGGSYISETDVTQLESAILNLAINARDAMPRGGSLRIKLDTVQFDEAYVSAHEDLSAGLYIWLSVSDTGTGMSEEVRKHAFDPFYTTKDVSRGNGLGLSMVHGFIKQCHGHVSISSEPGEGTEVSLFLPVKSEGSAVQPVEPSTENLQGHGELVLVVEDHAELLELVVQLLDELGYRTLVAKDGLEALKQLNSEPAVHLLYSDVILPGGMNGIELAETARCIFPDLKVLLTSGFTGDANFDSLGLEAYTLLKKPYDKVQLARSLNKILAHDELCL